MRDLKNAIKKHAHVLGEYFNDESITEFCVRIVKSKSKTIPVTGCGGL
jgi:hypothetical protein